MRKTYKYRLYPTSSQEAILNHTLGVCRWVYNTLLASKRDAWENEQRSLSKYDLCNLIPDLKQQHPAWKTVHSQVLQNISDRVSKAFENFYRRVKAGVAEPGYPRFKGYGRYHSFTYPQYGNGAVLYPMEGKDAYMMASKIGRVYIKYHRPINGTIKTITISKNVINEWSVCFSVECEQINADPPIGADVGIDVGLATFAAFSDGCTIENPRFFRTEEVDLAKVQRKQSAAYTDTKQRGHLARNKEGRTRKHTGYLNKRAKATSKVHKRIANKRRNFVHQETQKIVRFFGAIYVEKLNIDAMVKNHCLAKSISDAAWGMFLKILADKAESAGRRFHAVDPRKTSQWCSGCGEVVKKNLATRTHNCLFCGLVLDRDHNAARNILALGRKFQP